MSLLTYIIRPWFIFGAMDGFLTKMVTRMKYQDYQLQQMELKIKAIESISADMIRRERLRESRDNV